MEQLTTIIPNYNKIKYLEYCVNSILIQSFLPSEIIIVDDCSSDGSRELIQRLAQKHSIIKPILLNQNGGVSRARNIGLENALSDIVTFIDSDDYYYDPNKLKNEIQQLKAVESKGHKALAYSTTIIVDENGKLIDCRSNKRQTQKQFIQGNHTLKTFVSLSKQKRVPRDYCVRKETLVEVGAFSYPKNFYEDLDLLMRLSKQGVFFQPTYQPGTAYRQVSNGLSKQASELHDKEINSICNQYSEYLSTTDKLISYLIRNNLYVKNSIIDLGKKIIEKLN